MQIEVCENWRILRERWANFSALDSDTRRQWWFRGQGNADWSLETTLDREFQFADDEDRNDTIQSLLTAFKRELFYLGDDGSAELQGEALELFARHHGLPTQLMDWSESPYVATFFALTDAIRSRSDTACVWALNRSRFEPSPDAVDLIDDFELLRFNERALRQRGVFIRVSTIRQPFVEIVSNALTQFVVSTSDAKAAIADLELMTVNETYLFDNAESAARTASMRQTLRRMQ